MMSSPKQSKTGLGHLLSVGGSNSPRFVPPVLREVGKLAAGVASVSTTASATGNPRNRCILKPGHSHLDWVRLTNSRDLTGLGERAGKLEVTLEELAKHNKITDGWLAINGKVFNVTAYFPFHPGGVDELKKGLGIDATKLFYEVHKWVNFETLLRSCYVGRLLTSPQQESREPNPPQMFDQAQGPSNDMNQPNLQPGPPSPQPGPPSPQPGPPSPQPGAHSPQPGAPSPQPGAPSPQPGPPGLQGGPPLPQPGPSINGQAGNEPMDIARTGTDDAYPRGLKEESLEIHSFQSTHEDPEMELTTSNFYTKYQNNSNVPRLMPKFQWIQKSSLICISFTIRRFSNPLVEVKKLGKDAIQVIVCYDDKIFINDVCFVGEVLWPCAMKLTEESGMIELTFKKAVKKAWVDYGQLRQMNKVGCFPETTRINYVMTSKEEINSNIFLIELQRTDGMAISVPIGHHLRVFSGSEDNILSRSYTPIPKPQNIFPKPANATWVGDTIQLMVKRYENGNVSKYLCDAPEGTVVQASRPMSPGFDLVRVHDKDRFICIAAGTGITPMLSLMLAMLQRRSRKCKRFATLFCNRRKEDIPFLEEYKELMATERTKDNRISVKHILTAPEIPKEPNFLRGPITIEHVGDAVEEIYTPRIGIEDDLFVFVCGPTMFNKTCLQFLEELGIPDDQIFVFQE